jgi:hypothetical protein
MQRIATQCQRMDAFITVSEASYYAPGVHPQHSEVVHKAAPGTLQTVVYYLRSLCTDAVHCCCSPERAHHWSLVLQVRTEQAMHRNNINQHGEYISGITKRQVPTHPSVSHTSCCGLWQGTCHAVAPCRCAYAHKVCMPILAGQACTKPSASQILG